jgi:hypothetical protein
MGFFARNLAEIRPIIFVFGATSCSSEREIDAGIGGSKGDGNTVGQPAGVECALDNLTQACRCESGSHGRQRCVSSRWSSCECDETTTKTATDGSAATLWGVDPLENRNSASFTWATTKPSAGSCLAGRYEGKFDGWLGPSDLQVIPIKSVPVPDNPGLAFDLNQEGKGEEFSVSNGKMYGAVYVAFDFSADVFGKLDCDTLKFKAQLVNGLFYFGPKELGFEATQFVGSIEADTPWSTAYGKRSV